MATNEKPRVVFYLGGGKMNKKTRWPNQYTRSQTPAEHTIIQLNSSDKPTNITLFQQSVYKLLNNIWYCILKAFQKE